jgi:hypothetical protein
MIYFGEYNVRAMGFGQHNVRAIHELPLPNFQIHKK